MVSPRWRKVRRDVWLHKPRTLLVVLAIAVGIIGAGTVLNTWALLRRVTREQYRATNPASATLQTDSIDAALLSRVRALPAIRSAQARRTIVAAVEIGGTWRTAMLFVMEDFADISIGKLAPDQGAWPPPDDALVIERSSVEFAGAAVGDSAVLRIPGVALRTLPIAGIARDAGLAPGWMEHVVYGFIARNTLARMGAPASLNQLEIVVRDAGLDREAIRRVAYQVKATVESSGGTVTGVDVPVPGRHIHAAQMDSLLYTQGAFGALALLLSGFLVINLITAMLAGQVREIGVMKVLGASWGQLTRMYLALALVLGLVACVIALPVAVVLGRAYARFAGDLLNFDISGFAIPAGAILVQLAVGILLPVLAALVPVIRGCRLPVGEALRDFGIHGLRAGEPGGASRWLERFGGATRPLLLSLRNAFRRRQRMALTLLTLATGGAVYLGALNLRASIRGSVGELYGKVMRFDMGFRLAETHSPDSIEVAARVDGVAAVEAWGAARAGALLGGGTLGNSFSVSGVPPGSGMVAFPVLEGRWLQRGDSNALVLSKRLAEDAPELALGKTVTLMLGGRPRQWVVVGIVQAGPSGGAYVTRDALAGASGESRVDRIVVIAEPKGLASQTELIQRLRGALVERGFAVESSQLMQAARTVLEDHLLMVAGFLLIMSQLTIVVGGLGLASTMSLSVLERTREIGVLRAIGAQHGAILLMVQVEGLVISLLSWLLAIPLSLPMSVILGRAFGRVMMPVAVTWVPEPAGVLQWLGVVLGVSLLACAWPALRATRVPTAAALAYE